MNEHNLHPLTKEQSDFAAQNYNLVFSFLEERGLDAQEYYDAVIFSFLQAAQTYDETPMFQTKSFVVVATAYMHKALNKHLAKQSCRCNADTACSNRQFRAFRIGNSSCVA